MPLASNLPPRRLGVQVQRQEDATIVRCRGNLTAEVTDSFREEIKALIAPGKCLVLDLTEVRRMDSSGLGTVVKLYVSARKAGCDLRLINFNKQVRQLLGLTNLLAVFEACGEFRIRLP
ncbi:MAG TPA: STAS domain-containing protein [Terriglobales bacterium]|nr:STAS domain-containing protein [Terriglobales bacterium]